MKKDAVFSFTAPNGAVVLGVVVAILSSNEWQTVFLCYAQNRLFTYYKHKERDFETGELSSSLYFGETLVEYAILPDYDNVLEMANDMYEEDIITSYLEREC